MFLREGENKFIMNIYIYIKNEIDWKQKQGLSFVKLWIGLNNIYNFADILFN